MKQIIEIKGKKYDELREEMEVIKSMLRECEDSIFTSLYFSNEFEYYKNFAGNLEFFERISELSSTYSKIMRSKMDQLFIEIKRYISMINTIPYTLKAEDKVILVSPDIAVVSDETLPSSNIIKLGVNYNIHLLNEKEIENALFEAARNRLKNYSVMMSVDDKRYIHNTLMNSKN